MSSDLMTSLVEAQRRALALNVAAYRARRGVLLGELATATGLPYPLLRKIESGTANPTLRTLSRIARTLDFSVADLLSPRPGIVLDLDNLQTWTPGSAEELGA